MLRGLTPGEPVMVAVTQPRSLRQHRLMFALLRRVHENLPADQRARFPTVERLLESIKLALGHTEDIWNLRSGEGWVKVKSISFESMDQAEFAEFFVGAVEVITTYVIEELDAGDLLEEVHRMLD